MVRGELQERKNSARKSKSKEASHPQVIGVRLINIRNAFPLHLHVCLDMSSKIYLSYLSMKQ